MSVVKAVRGMNDILPGDSDTWQYVETALRSIFGAYAYREIRLPLIEKTELFARSIGESTDIVAKEMYTFDDRNGESLSLRPEATASCVRAGIEHGLFFNQTQRLWYMGPMFRHERPQRGRYRQFYQAGAEAFGWPGPDTDAELIALSSRFWDELNLPVRPRLEINSLGDIPSRRRYREQLVNYLRGFETELDEDSRRRLETNPLRILDSKDAGTQKVLEEAPSILVCLDAESRQHFDGLCALLDELGIAYTVNHRLVRGLDYYNRSVFEWVTDELGAQSAVCAGGRYDGLVQQLGGKQPIPAAGFALGMDRLVELVKSGPGLSAGSGVDIYMVAVGESGKIKSWSYAELLRNNGFKVEMFCGEGSIKSQMKRADKSGATLSLLVGEDEINSESVTIKPMRRDEEQVNVPEHQLIDTVSACIREREV